MGFVISRANVGRHTAGTDTGVIPCPLVSACVRGEGYRKGKRTDRKGNAKAKNANHAEQRELKPYARFRWIIRERQDGIIQS